jgi:hypothetical protein
LIPENFDGIGFEGAAFSRGRQQIIEVFFFVSQACFLLKHFCQSRISDAGEPAAQRDRAITMREKISNTPELLPPFGFRPARM